MRKRYQIRIRTRNEEETYSTDNIEDTLLEVLTEYRRNGKKIQDIRISRGTLEEHFMELAKEGAK